MNPVLKAPVIKTLIFTCDELLSSFIFAFSLSRCMAELLNFVFTTFDDALEAFGSAVYKVGQCRLSVSRPVLRAPMVSELEIGISKLLSCWISILTCAFKSRWRRWVQCTWLARGSPSPARTTARRSPFWRSTCTTSLTRRSPSAPQGLTLVNFLSRLVRTLKPTQQANAIPQNVLTSSKPWTGLLLLTASAHVAFPYGQNGGGSRNGTPPGPTTSVPAGHSDELQLLDQIPF